MPRLTRKQLIEIDGGCNEDVAAFERQLACQALARELRWHWRTDTPVPVNMTGPRLIGARSRRAANS
jgi:hypothetical protein